MNTGSVPIDEEAMEELKVELDGDSACRESVRSLTRFGSITQQMRQGYHGISRSLRKARAGVSKAFETSTIADSVQEEAYNERYSQRSPTPAPPNSKIMPTGSPFHTPSSLLTRTNVDGSITRDPRLRSPFSPFKRKDSHQHLLLSSSPPTVPATERSLSPSPAAKGIFYRSHGSSFRHKLERARSSLSLSGGKMRTVEIQDSIGRRPSSPILIGGGRIPLLDLDLEQRPLSAMVSVDPRFERSEEHTPGAAGTFVVGTPPRTPAPIDRNIPPTLLYGSGSNASSVTPAYANNFIPIRDDETCSTAAWSDDARVPTDTHKLTEAVKHTLRLAFLKDHEPTDAGLADLADDLGLCSSQVAAWFKDTRTAVIRHSLLSEAPLSDGYLRLKNSQPSGLFAHVDASRGTQGRVRSLEPENPFLSATGEGREKSDMQQILDIRTTGSPSQNHCKSTDHSQSPYSVTSTLANAPTYGNHTTRVTSCQQPTTNDVEQSSASSSPNSKGQRRVDLEDHLHASEHVRRVCIIKGRPVSNLETRTAPYQPLTLLEGKREEKFYGTSDCCTQQASYVSGQSSKPESGIYPSRGSTQLPRGYSNCIWLPFKTPTSLRGIEAIQTRVNEAFLNGEMFPWGPELDAWRKSVLQDSRDAGSRSGFKSCDGHGQMYHDGDFHPDSLVNQAKTSNDDEDYGYDNRRGRYVKLPELEHRIFAKVLDGVDPALVSVSIVSSHQKPDIHMYLRPPPLGNLVRGDQAETEKPSPTLDQEGRMRGGWSEEQLANNDDLYELSDHEQDTVSQLRSSNSSHHVDSSNAITGEILERDPSRSSLIDQNLHEDCDSAMPKNEAANSCDDPNGDDAPHDVADRTAADVDRNGNIHSSPKKAAKTKRKGYRVAKGNQTADADARRHSKTKPKTQRKANMDKSEPAESDLVEKPKTSIELPRRSKIRGDENRSVGDRSQDDVPDADDVVETAVSQDSGVEILGAN